MAVFSRKQVDSGTLEKPAPRIEERKAEVILEEPEELPPEVPAKPKADDPWFVLQHPDQTTGNDINATIDIEGEKVEIEHGRVETQRPCTRDELLRREWRWMNERI